MIEILSSGPANTIQDSGRRGRLHLGISRSGAMDPLALALANALLDNPEGAAGIEVAMFPFRVRFDADTRIALTGADALAELDGVPVPPLWSLPAPAGSVLTLHPPRHGARSYLGLAGGIDVAPVLGARATDLKSGFGGLEGRGLARGDRLPIGRAPDRVLTASGFGARPDTDMTAFWARPGTATVRVIPAAEFDEFSDTARDSFFAARWEITGEANRMGYRLSGHMLDRPRGRELLSHGLLPGVVQVPASGQPIVQLADANTCGGYPKMAMVIAPDLWKIAQLGPGEHLRFARTTQADGMAALHAQATFLDRVGKAARAALS